MYIYLDIESTEAVTLALFQTVLIRSKYSEVDCDWLLENVHQSLLKSVLSSLEKNKRNGEKRVVEQVATKVTHLNVVSSCTLGCRTGVRLLETYRPAFKQKQRVSEVAQYRTIIRAATMSRRCQH